ncbi:OB-fold domain-containing protein [Myxococcota bacterium]|nr:OB-fold domain-containing protein [Myxococcota bacterium]
MTASHSQIPSKPIPLIDEDNEAFWASCRRHAMELQRCSECDYWRYYPSPVCHRCSSFEFEWTPVSGLGTVYTYSVVYRPPSAAFAEEVPYVYAVVELEEGPMMPTNIVGIEPSEVTIGLSVQVTYEDVNDSIALPKFEPQP